MPGYAPKFPSSSQLPSMLLPRGHQGGPGVLMMIVVVMMMIDDSTKT